MAEFIEHFVVPNGSEVLVNSTTANNQDQPRITKLAGGGFVVLWRDASGALGTGTQTEVRAQIYDANGAPVGAELLLNATFSTATNFPSIAALPGGGFVASWSDSSAGIILRQFDAAGTPATGEVSVQTTNGLTLGSRPDIAVQPNGQYLVTWHVQVAGENGGPNNFDVRGRLFGADGPLGVDFLVTAGTVGDQGRPRVAALSSGQYLVTWDENVGDGTLLNVKAQLLDATGARIGGEISVAQQAGNQFEPVVASLPDGRFVISWSAVEAGLTTLDVRAQLFSATGAKLGLEFRVNTETASDQTRPTVAALSDGRFLISWTDNGTTADPSPAGIKARLFDADGAALGTEFLVNSFTQNGQTDSAVAVLASGKLAVVWRDQSAQSMGSSVDSSGSGIKLQLLQALPHIVGTSGDDFLFGGAGGEIFEALGGNDLVSAGGGDDQIEGGDGNDSLNGGDGRDALWGGSGNDSLDGGAGADDFLYGGDGDDTLNDSLGGSGVLLGEAGNDTISVSGAAGGFTGFRLDGGEGDDVLSAASNGPATLSASLNGGEGNDRLTITGAVSGGLFGEEGDDIITFAGRGATIDGGPGNDTIYLNGQNATIHVSKDFYTDLGRDLIIPAAVGGFVTIIGFAAGEAGDRLDLSVYGADPFRAGGPLTYTQNGPDTLIDHAATGKRFVLQNVRFSDLSVFNLGVQTGAYNPQGRTIDDAFADQPNTDFPGYLIGADAADIIRGHGGADMLFGGGGNDRIEGGVGDDRIFGGTGADTMIGGAGNDSYEVDGLDDVVIEAAGEGVADEIRTTLSNYQLPANVERLVYIGAGSATFTGSAGGNHFTGAAAGDVFFLQQGGDDTAFGGGGNDGFYLGAALNAGDELDGGAGTLDQLGLQGNYAGLTLGPKNLVGIEQIVLLPGSDTRFGDTSGALYSYNLTTVDANVAAGQRLVITANTLRVGENVTFNGAAEIDGFFLTYGGQGTEILTGSQTGDGFFFGAGDRFGAGDKIDGQGGFDQIGLQGRYVGASAITLGADQITSIEQIVMLSGGDARFGSDGLGYSYDLTTNNGNVAAGGTLVITANTLRSDESLTFNGSAETDGRFRIFSGDGADSIRGSAGADDIFGRGGNDSIVGGLGGDRITGGEGADTFILGSAAESTSTGFDTLMGFDHRVDRIDVPGTVSAFTARIETGRLDGSSFDADLAAAVDGALEAFSGLIYRPDSGSFAGRSFAIIDADGDGLYQAGQDFVIELADLVVPIPTNTDFFI